MKWDVKDQRIAQLTNERDEMRIRLNEFQREHDESIAIIQGFGTITCGNGRHHEVDTNNCLYCQLADTRAKLDALMEAAKDLQYFIPFDVGLDDAIRASEETKGDDRC